MSSFRPACDDPRSYHRNVYGLACTLLAFQAFYLNELAEALVNRSTVIIQDWYLPDMRAHSQDAAVATQYKLRYLPHSK
jgi:hypothetical protein